MRKERGGRFVPKQGGLLPEPEDKPAFAGLPADIRPLWHEVGDSVEPKSNIEPEKMPDFSKGGERLW
jgi:hypothetical protein